MAATRNVVDEFYDNYGSLLRLLEKTERYHCKAGQTSSFGE